MINSLKNVVKSMTKLIEIQLVLTSLIFISEVIQLMYLRSSHIYDKATCSFGVVYVFFSVPFLRDGNFYNRNPVAEI